MEFTSCLFLFVFFPASFIAFYITPSRIKKYVLLAISLAFFSSISISTLPVLIAVIIVNYILGLIIGKSKKKKILLILSIICNIGLLVFYKYIDFIFTNVNEIFDTQINKINLIVPLGISFFTFQIVSYLVDIYKGKCKSERNIINFALYICFFPRVVSGPIVRYEKFQSNITNLERPKLNNLYIGIKRICFGLGKVAILSTIMGEVWHSIYYSNVSVVTAWLGIICYSFQLYLNFSGYMDISIGLGKLFGIDLPENFDYPYTATSISDFWRRWHITLSSWFRDYVYIPLGGNRKGNVYLHLFIVFLLTGLWHGASWKFLFWGIYHGIWIVFERIIRDKTWYKKIPKLLKQISTYIIVLLGWVLFASEGMSAAIKYYKSMFGIQKIDFIQFELSYFLNRYTIFFLILCILTSLPIKRIVENRIHNEKIKDILTGIFALGVLAISIMFIINNAYTPSMYAQF